MARPPECPAAALSASADGSRRAAPWSAAGSPSSWPAGEPAEAVTVPPARPMSSPPRTAKPVPGTGTHPVVPGC